MDKGKEKKIPYSSLGEEEQEYVRSYIFMRYLAGDSINAILLNLRDEKRIGIRETVISQLIKENGWDKKRSAAQVRGIIKELSEGVEVNLEPAEKENLPTVEDINDELLRNHAIQQRKFYKEALQMRQIASEIYKELAFEWEEIYDTSTGKLLIAEKKIKTTVNGQPLLRQSMPKGAYLRLQLANSLYENGTSELSRLEAELQLALLDKLNPENLQKMTNEELDQHVERVKELLPPTCLS